ncbi:hypothetical protein QQ045_012610 [Rhodiola kirilowii]
MLGGGASIATLVSSGHQEGKDDNLARHETINNNNLMGVFGEEEINDARNGTNNMEDGDRNLTGNRWPRQETLALLKIRSDMDVAFRDSNLKGPLWDDVSRKMAELGYQRSAKKCKEKFENVYKYHKRTKDGRSSKSDGKTYRFFDQLEALDQLQPFQMSSSPPQQPQAARSKGGGGLSFQMPPPPHPPLVLQTPTTISFGQHQPCINILKNPITTAPVSTNPSNTISPNFQSGANFMVSTSSSTSSDDFQPQRRSGKKRKWKDFFEKLMRDVLDKQEELQSKFLRTIEMRERERCMREEAWRMQEMARLNREHEILVQERSAAAAKDAAVIAYLQKIAGQQPQTQPPQPPPPQPKQQPPAPVPHTIQLISSTTTPPPPPPQPQAKPVISVMKQPDHNPNAGDLNKVMVCSSTTTTTPPSSSRWPKAEVEALIKLRTSFEIKYQENGPKGPFWEEISAGMRSLGYTRNAKRCKEKWENINKYFKKVKESNKQRPEDSKTCPYYHLLDAIYKEKKLGSGDYNYPPPLPNSNSLMAPLMVQPEQQWPLAPQALISSSHAQNSNNEDEEQDDMLDEEELDQDMEDDELEADDNNSGGTYEVVATASNNKPQHGASATSGSMETAVA